MLFLLVPFPSYSQHAVNHRSGSAYMFFDLLFTALIFLALLCTS
jgi:hypothetical protein